MTIDTRYMRYTVNFASQNATALPSFIVQLLDRPLVLSLDSNIPFDIIFEDSRNFKASRAWRQSRNPDNDKPKPKPRRAKKRKKKREERKKLDSPSTQREQRGKRRQREASQWRNRKEAITSAESVSGDLAVKQSFEKTRLSIKLPVKDPTILLNQTGDSRGSHPSSRTQRSSRRWIKGTRTKTDRERTARDRDRDS